MVKITEALPAAVAICNSNNLNVQWKQTSTIAIIKYAQHANSNMLLLMATATTIWKAHCPKQQQQQQL